MPTLHTFLSQKHDVIADCETKLGYTFGGKQHCFAALNATGFRLRWSTDTSVAIKNDRLAILGDIMLDANLALKWFNNTTYDKGIWNRARSVTASDANLAHVGFSHGLDQCIALDPGTMAVSQKTMATTVEALIGAAYQDGGDLAVDQVISQLGIDHEHLHAVTYKSLQHTSFEIRHSPLTNRVLVFGLYV